MSVFVDLEWYEIRLAAEVGVLRRVESKRRGGRDLGLGPSDWNVDIMGAVGELAVAKYRGVYWDGSINTFKAPDVGALQIRWAPRATDCLIVRPGDSDTDWYVLTRGSPTTAETIEIVGYIKGAAAKREEFQRAPGGMAPAYFVPGDRLRPLEAI